MHSQRGEAERRPIRLASQPARSQAERQARSDAQFQFAEMDSRRRSRSAANAMHARMPSCGSSIDVSGAFLAGRRRRLCPASLLQNSLPSLVEERDDLLLRLRCKESRLLVSNLADHPDGPDLIPLHRTAQCGSHCWTLLRLSFLCAQRMAARLRPRARLPRSVSPAAARAAEGCGRQLQRLGQRAIHLRPNIARNELLKLVLLIQSRVAEGFRHRSE